MLAEQFVIGNELIWFACYYQIECKLIRILAIIGHNGQRRISSVIAIELADLNTKLAS